MKFFPGRLACLPLSLALCCTLLTPAAWAASSPSAATKNSASQSHKKSAKRAAVRKAAHTETSSEFANFNQWKEVAEFIEDMRARHGFDKTELETIFRNTHYVDTTIRLMKPAPPGKPKNWQAYRERFVEPVRINAGVEFWESYQYALQRAEREYGVPAAIIVGILGVETLYGRYTGNFRVLDALTTLAFDYPDTPTRSARMKFFRGELESTLLFARESALDPLSLQGSYAGAIGWPQFMPSSIRQYAVDFDSDGKIDLRNSPVDAIGSIANFLVQHGWKRDEPIVFPVQAPTPASVSVPAAWAQLIDAQKLSAPYSAEELARAGAMPATELPADMRFGLIDLQNGFEPTEYWLGGANFFSIAHYNRSFFYAMSVVELGQAVQAARMR